MLFLSDSAMSALLESWEDEMTDDTYAELSAMAGEARPVDHDRNRVMLLTHFGMVEVV